MDYNQIESLIKSFRDEADKNARKWEKEFKKLAKEGNSSDEYADCMASLYICIGEVAAYNTILQNIDKLK